MGDPGAAAALNSRAPLPEPALAVAIVGHRPDRLTDVPSVKARIAEVINAIWHAADVALAAGTKPRLRLVSALAEGADRLGAQAALEAGAALDVVLPFPVGEYLRDFESRGSRDEFEALVDRAESILILDGTPSVRDRAYEAAGRALLDNCDLLIAVFDDGPGRGRGGTREVIEEAVRRGTPVMTIDPAGKSARLRVAAGPPSGSVRLEDLPVTPLAQVGAVVARIVAPSSDLEEREWIAGLQLPPRSWSHAAYPLLLRLLGLGRKRGAAQSHVPPQSSMERAFDWWDSTAIAAAQGFRSAVVVNFGLAALAVVLAAGSLLAGGAKWVFVVAEVATILLLLGNIWSARRSRWQDRWLESREVAEMLRVSLMLQRVGIGRPLRAGADLRNCISYVLAVARSSRPEAVDLSDSSAASQVLIEPIEMQAAWNAANARRMHSAGHRLGLVGEVLFAIVLAASVAWLALGAIRPALAESTEYALTAITAGLPAIASATYGIRLILDFEGSAQRSRRMAGELQSLVAAWRSGPATAASLQALAQGAMDVMLGDVAKWRLLAEARRLTVPG